LNLTKNIDKTKFDIIKERQQTKSSRLDMVP